MMFEKERERERNKERGMLYKNFIYFSRVKKKAYQKKKKNKNESIMTKFIFYSFKKIKI